MEKEPTAWMLRRDGKSFSCQSHYYANPAEIVKTMHTAEWLYGATQNDETRRQIIDLIAAYGASLHSKRNLVRNLLLTIKNQPSFPLSRTFITLHAAEFFYVDPQCIPKLSAAITEALNTEFLRTRLGGIYETVPENRDLNFRVSGTDFNWLPVIRNFAKSHADVADTVTVLWDLESTGQDGFWTDESGRVFDHALLMEI